MSFVYSQILAPVGRIAPLVILAFFSVVAAPSAQNKGAKGADPVVAQVDGTIIRQSDVVAALENLPPQYAQVPRETLVKAVTEKLIDGTLAANRARAAGLHKDPMYLVARARAELQLLEQLFIQRLVARRVTERAVRRRYQRDRKSLVREKQIRARHILLKTRQQALNVINELGRGKDFAELARKHSTGPSKAQDIKAAAPPRFEEVRVELERKMSDEVIEKEMEGLRKGAKIKRFPPTGAPARSPKKKGK
jgi:peptidyl-prolyl cis-trans isomerase C